MLPAGDTENLYPALAQQHLSPVLFGMVVASIFAAIMSTADSQLLVAASSVVRDVYQKVLKKGEVVSERTLVLYSRIVVAALVVIALIMGVVAEQLVFWLVLFAWAGLGAALGPASVLALYWKRTPGPESSRGWLTGAVVTMVWYLTPALKGRIYELIPAVILAVLAIILVSRADRATRECRRGLRCDARSRSVVGNAQVSASVRYRRHRRAWGSGQLFAHGDDGGLGDQVRSRPRPDELLQPRR